MPIADRGSLGDSCRIKKKKAKSVKVAQQHHLDFSVFNIGKVRDKNNHFYICLTLQ
jgi:hypothetical protein